MRKAGGEGKKGKIFLEDKVCHIPLTRWQWIDPYLAARPLSLDEWHYNREGL